MQLTEDAMDYAEVCRILDATVGGIEQVSVSSGCASEVQLAGILLHLDEIGKKVLSGLYLELVDEYPCEVSLLLFSNRRVLSDSSHLLIQDFFFLFQHLLYLLSERS